MSGGNLLTDNIGLEHDPRLLTTLSSSIRSTITLDHNNHGGEIWRHRPRSTPLSASHTLMTSLSSQKVPRPSTVTVTLGRNECDRVRQLEHEPTRRHNLASHLPLKRRKPPHWQKSLENPVVNFQLGHGYTLSRSKNRNHVTITDEFFEPILQDTSSTSRKQMPSDPDRDGLVVQLQQQISDLCLYLEEERLNHKQTKRKAEELLKDRVDQMNSQFQDQIRDIVADHKEELLKQKQAIDAQHKGIQDTMENQIGRMAKDIELLQSAFESYKGTLHEEASQKLDTKDDELKLKFAEEKQQAIHEMKTKLIQEQNQERATMVKEHQKAIETLRKENKREMDHLLRKFSSAAADIERLKEATAELEETKSELETMKDSYNTACQLLTNRTNQLTDAKVRLVEFEERFEEKVSQVDDRYRHRLQELMTQNTELKRIFVQKCGELYDEKANSDYMTTQRVKSARQAMELLVNSKQQANTSTAADKTVQKVVDSKSRPLSAPGTRN